MTREIGDPVSLDAVQPVPSRESGVVAVAAIAQPERFSRALEQAGWRVAKLMGFRDHYQYGSDDLRRIERAVQETSAAGVLTTEKDAMRLRRLRPFTVPMAFVPLRVHIEPGAAFKEWLLGRVREQRQ
jgi:tetraacyldisaccharide 4'-kinase